MASTIEPRETGRRRDSAATRQALLEAARALFGTKGYEGTSLREIGERAGVDASLIARYFGNKVALYSATLDADRMATDGTTDLTDPEALTRRLLRRVDANGLGPIIQALIETDVDPEIRHSAREHMRRRILIPLTNELRAAEIDHPDLRAELVLATVLGLVTTRATDSLPTVANASHEEIVGLLRPALMAIAGRD